MACAKPLTAYLTEQRSLTFNHNAPGIARTLYLPCNKCVLCRVGRARDVASRLMCEGHMHAESAVATLTYAPEHLEPLGSVSRVTIQLFMKRLRQPVARRGGSPIRFHLIAEYSPERLRPHYHLCLFGYWPPDAKVWAKSRAGNQEFVSGELTGAWGKGHATFQRFSAGAAAYCAHHQSFKLLDDLSVAQLGDREAPFELRSLRPGLGASFFARYGQQMLDHDFVVVDGRKCPLPKYFDVLAGRVDPGRLSELKAARELLASESAGENSDARLAVRAQCAAAALALKRRDGVRRG